MSQRVGVARVSECKLRADCH